MLNDVAPSAQPAPPPHERNALRMLEMALGCSLASVAVSASQRAAAGLLPGREGVMRTNVYKSVIDYVEECLQVDRDSARRADNNATRAQYAEIDDRLAVIAAFGAPLARRAALLDAIRDAEADKREAIFAIDTAEAEVARCGQRPTGDSIDALGAAAARSTAQ